MRPPDPNPIGARARRVAQLAAVATMWAVIAAGWIAVQRRTGLGPVATLQRAIDVARDSWWAVLAYLAVGIVRPFVFLPATLLTVAAGMLFGPVLGLLVAVVASNASAMLGYHVGRMLVPGAGRRAPADADGVSVGGLAGWTERLRQNSFEAVLLMRLIFLPYDAVNATAGVLRIGWRPFLAATALGSLPGTLAFVLAGTSIDRLDAAGSGIDTRALIASLAVFAASITAARILRRRSAQPRTAPG